MSIERFIEIASNAVGLHAGDAAFRALVGPGETEAMQATLATKSTCALFARGCLAQTLMDLYDKEANEPVPVHGGPGGAVVGRRMRHQGPPPRLWAPYVDGMAVTDLVATLASVGRDPGRITRGSIVIVGGGMSTHVFVAESIENDGWDDRWTLTAIEAGQRDQFGRQCVVRRRHEIVDGLDVALVRDKTGHMWVRMSSPRRVSHILDPRPLLEGRTT